MSTNSRLGVLVGSVLLGLSVPVIAQQDSTKDDVLAVRARRLETVSDGVIENGIVLIRNGKIASVGKTVKIPVGARVITADTVMPGIVGAFSQIGLSGPAAGPAPSLPPNIPPQFAGRFQGLGGGRPTANTHFRVLDELYPFDPAYSRLPRAGVTSLALVPEGRGFTGQGVVIKPAGETAEKMAIAQTSPLAINFAQDTQSQDLIRTTLQGGGAGGRTAYPTETFNSPGGLKFEADETADSGYNFQRRRGGGFQRPVGGAPNAPSSFTAAARRAPITKAIAGDTPTFITCTDSAAIVYALTLFQAFDKLKPVYVLSLDSYRVADMLGQKKLSVIIPADLTFEPNTRNKVNTAAILAKAGVKLACRPVSDSVAGYEGLLNKMAELVKCGLDRETALKSITLNPAEMLGLQEKVGSVQFGRDANLILLDGDPLSSTTKITSVLLEGKTVFDGK